MKRFIKLTKFYFIMNLKLYLCFIGISLIVLSIMLGIFWNVRDVPFDYFLIVIYGFVGIPLLGMVAFTNNKYEVFFILNRNRLRQLIVFMVYPIIVVGILSITYVWIRRGDTFELNDIVTQTGIVAGIYFYTIIFLLQLFAMRKDKKILSNLWVVILMVIGWNIINQGLDLSEELANGTSLILSIIGVIMTFVIVFTPMICVVYLYRKLEV